VSPICAAALRHGIKIEHACEMSCACTTCHVVVREGVDSLNEMDDLEADMLDKAWGLEPDSRLSCQAIVEDEDSGGGDSEIHHQSRLRKALTTDRCRHRRMHYVDEMDGLT
jgi:ferredoxin